VKKSSFLFQGGGLYRKGTSELFGLLYCLLLLTVGIKLIHLYILVLNETA
jgi:hypothetical protein